MTPRAAPTLRVLGIDPGLTRLGWGVVDVAANRTATLVAYGVIRTRADSHAGDRLAAVADGIDEVIATHIPTAAAVERVFTQHNLRTVIGTAQASGVALERLRRAGLPVGTHTPSEVKAAVSGYGNADKAQVAAMVARVLRLAEPPKPADAADALALALCHAWRGGGAAAAGGSTGGSSLTPAQRAWQEAERSAKRPR